MSNGSDQLRGKTHRLSLVLLCFLCSCSWFRADTERFYYDYAIKMVKSGVSQKVRDRCNFTTDFDPPTFSQLPQTDLDLFYKEQHLPYKIGGFYSAYQRKIVYSKWRPEIIVHETMHHLDSMNGLSKRCLEEFLAEMVQYAMEQDSEILHLHNRLSRGK